MRQKGQNKAFGQNICEKLFVHLNFYLLLRADWKCHATKQTSRAHFPGGFHPPDTDCLRSEGFLQKADSFTPQTIPNSFVPPAWAGTDEGAYHYQP